jgi:ribosomal protein L37AE/L43A
MAIPETQLTTWAKIGAQETSKTTYATMKGALESKDAGYQGRDYDVFLQGSYGNDTNIWKESDVDVVIRLNSVFSYDNSTLPEQQRIAWRAAYTDATYTHAHFRQDVLKILRSRFTDDVQEGKKAVQIKPNGNRRKADVLITLIHKRYISFDSIATEKSVDGIAFWKLDGTKVINYPNQHRDNLIAKNSETETNGWFKHIVRIFKNARQRMLEDGLIEAGIAPSYYLEGLLFNVPTDRFGNTYGDSMSKCINWLWAADRSKFVCANKQYQLLDGPADVTWKSQDCTVYLAGLIKLWNGWT